MGVLFDEEVVALGWAKLTFKTGSTHFGVDLVDTEGLDRDRTSFVEVSRAVTEGLGTTSRAEVSRKAVTEGLDTTSRVEVSRSESETEAASCTSFLGSALAANVSTVGPTALG